MRRRQFLSHCATVFAAGIATRPSLARAQELSFSLAELRGTVNSSEYGVLPDALDDQSAKFQKMIDAAARRQVPLFLPGGTYALSNIKLPDGLSLRGVRGQTRLVYSGDGFLLSGNNLRGVQLSGLVLDGANRWMNESAHGLIDLRGVLDSDIRDCVVQGAPQDGLYLERCAGTIADNEISGTARFGLFSVEGHGLTIRDNRVHSCANGGIIIHRWNEGSDNSIVVNNRISDISAREGGTGQWGNGINLFRTHDVIVSGNTVQDCAFSSIRANAAKRLAVSDNQCNASGETAIYAEFGFEDVTINGNVINGATNGISVTNSDIGGRSATVSGNIIRNLSAKGSYEPMAPGFGIGIAVEADTTVTGNLIENAEQYGINAGWGPNLRDCVVSANVIRNAHIGIGVSAAKGAGTALISANSIHAHKGAILAHEWNRIVSGDLALSGARTPGNIIVENNRVT